MTGLANLGTYFFAAIRHFLPWTLLVLAGVVADWRTTAAFFRRYRKECWFLGGWFLLLVLLFSFGNMRRTRYLAD